MSAYHASQRKKVSPEERHQNLQLGFKIQQRMAREWLPYLKGSELKLAHFVLTHSLMRGKPSTHWHEKQIVEAGLGIGVRSFYNAMKSLKARGLLLAQKGYGAGWHFSLNPGWNPAGAVPTEGDSAGKVVTLRARKSAVKPVEQVPEEIPETAPEAPGEAQETGVSATAKVAVGHCKKCSHPKIDRFPGQTSPSLPTEETVGAPSSPAHQRSQAEEKNQGLPEKEGPPTARAPQPAARPNTGDTWERVWRKAWGDAQETGDVFPTRLPAAWSPKDKAQMKRLAKTWDERAHGTFADFLRFVVTHWPQIMREKFAWMTEKPAPRQPEPTFLYSGKNLRTFLDAFCEAETIRWVGTLPGTEQNIATLMQRGLSREGAILEAARLQAIESDRTQRQADVSHARRMYAMAELSKDAARREAATREKYRNAPRREREDFSPKTDREAGAPIIAEDIDFSAFGRDDA